MKATELTGAQQFGCW